METIAAVATPPGQGAIAVIRISGDTAFEICDKVFCSSKGKKIINTPTHCALYGTIIERKSGKKVDEVLALVMRGPHTFTGEDTVEISCHGGMMVTRMVLSELFSAGARMAEKGEFSKRAFLNGKLDLSEAEGIIDLINADTELGVFQNAGQMSGILTNSVLIEREALLALCAHIMARIDFPEEDIDEIFSDEVGKKLQAVLTTLSSLKESYTFGKILKEGVRLVIAGKPNVGKSSLLNRLAGYDRAIVTDIAGTTRDTIEEKISIGGIPFFITDTAGIHETQDAVEQVGVCRAKKALKEADLICLVMDIRQGITQMEQQIIDEFPDKKIIALYNKADLKGLLQLPGKVETEIATSMVSGRGVDELICKLKELFLFSNVTIGKDPMIMNIRQDEALRKAIQYLEKSLAAIHAGVDLDLVTIDIQEAIAALGELSGQTVGQEVVDAVFSRFCLGK